MTEDTTTLDSGEFYFMNFTTNNLKTGISRAFKNISSDNRANRYRRKLRNDLVKEHIENIENIQEPPSFLKSIIGKLFG